MQAIPNTLQPTMFLAHGNPMNALARDSPFSSALQQLVASLPQTPKAILMISAHWETVEGVPVICDAERPETIHDFYGFPKELFNVQYPAPGSPWLVEQVSKLLGQVKKTKKWGLDHGAWSLLVHMFPKADVPVVELSIDKHTSLKDHLAMAKKLYPLREQGVLIIGSGNIVHNLMEVDWEGGGKVHPWARDFDAWVAQQLNQGNFEALTDITKAPNGTGKKACPTLEHYIPLLYAAGAAGESHGPVSYPYKGIEMASLSMRSAVWIK